MAMQKLFEAVRRHDIASLGLSYEEYRHTGTGARHVHLAARDDNNCFMVALPTVPQDSTGVAHILEHTTLCGSERFPVRDPFFMMTRRSLYSFMNAFTSSDATAYPFATRNRRDFDNLLQVYLDCVFFPRLDELDFAQEGWRVEFAEAGNLASPLVYKGVVYNEMKGAMSSPVAQLAQELQSRLFPTTTYHYNSGGEPSAIPDLTFAALRAFHATHYHPSNALFMTYGDIPACDHQARLQELVLGRCAARPVDFSIPDERRFTAPVQHESGYRVSEESRAERTHIVLGWLLGRTTDIDEMLRCHVLSGVLMDNSASPLRHALETTGLGTAPSPLCGVDDSTREATFYAGLEGSSREHARAVEALILTVLERVARDGVAPELVEAVVQQIEMYQREVSGGEFPYGLQLMNRCLGTAMHGGDPLAALELDPAIERLRSAAAQPGFVPDLVRRLLLDNPHRVRLTLYPDPDKAREEAARETARLAELRATLDADAARQVLQQAAALERRQLAQDDPEILPALGISDVPTSETLPVPRVAPAGALQGHWYTAGTNGIVYQQLIVRIPALTEAERSALPGYWSYLTEVGCGTRDYLALQTQQSLAGSLRAYPSVTGSVTDSGSVEPYIALAGKGLARRSEELATLLSETLMTARFDELPRLRELVAQSRAAAESAITAHGHSLALLAATSGAGAAAQLDHAWDGLAGIRALQDLDDACERNESAVEAYAALLERIRDRMRAAQRHVLIVSEAEQQAPLAAQYERLWSTAAPTADSAFTPAFERRSVRQVWITSTQVNFCAQAFATVPADHPDAAVLAVLGRFLHNGYLHRAIREQGGAYGAGAGYDADSGAFRFFSYRDPRLEETLADFARARAWLHDNRHDDRQRVEAIMGVIRSLDQPYTPATQAIRAHFATLQGRGASYREQLRARLLAVTMAELRRVAEAWLVPGTESTVVITDAAGGARAVDLGLDRHELRVA